MKSIVTTALLLCAILPLHAGPPPAPEIQPAPAESSGWTFRLAPYVWAQWLDGTVGINGMNTDVNIGFDRIIKNLDFALMGVIEARYDRWALNADMTYAELSAKGQTPLGVLFNEAQFKQQQFLGNYTLGYSLVKRSGETLDIYAGARVNYIRMKLTFAGTVLPTSIVSGSETWVDPIVGARYRRQLGEKFFVQAGGDIGGFGANSRFTWSALALLGYNLGANTSVGLGYRALGTDYHRAGFKYDMIAHGPILGIEFRF